MQYDESGSLLGSVIGSRKAKCVLELLFPLVGVVVHCEIVKAIVQGIAYADRPRAFQLDSTSIGIVLVIGRNLAAEKPKQSGDLLSIQRTNV